MGDYYSINFSFVVRILCFQTSEFCFVQPLEEINAMIIDLV